MPTSSDHPDRTIRTVMPGAVGTIQHDGQDIPVVYLLLQTGGSVNGVLTRFDTRGLLPEILAFGDPIVTYQGTSAAPWATFVQYTRCAGPLKGESVPGSGGLREAIRVTFPPLTVDCHCRDGADFEWLR